MDWVSRLLGASPAPKKLSPKNTLNDPQVRLARFKRVYHTILQICNRQRDIANEGPVLDQLRSCIDKTVTLLREETRAPAPHLCLQFASANQLYAHCARASTVSQYEPIIKSTVAVYAALVDSEEEDFLSSAPFAKSLMRLVRRVIESGSILISIETETSILELLFTIAAKIRLQPEILGFWFQSTAKPELEDVFVQEKKSFVGITQKDDFPLCYLLIDRVHHDGRIGDFARTGLLYIFEATGRSDALEEWVVSSDLPTLMASGLGALFSQLSRELSILHPDATLPAVLAMSDYSTTHPRSTAESAFSERHRSHMATFLSYLAFWQDVLDHCKSADVKQTLLDHFQILFLQQLLYPSLLQSSDTDAGSSVAVLNYLDVMLQSLEYPQLMRMMLAYLLAIDAESSVLEDMEISLSKPPRSPTTLRRRQSLMLLAAPKDPDDAVEPSLFNLVDLIMNNLSSKNDQSVFAALKLASTLLNRQKTFALGTLIRVQSSKHHPVGRTTGSLDIEVEKLSELALSLHDQQDLQDAYTGLTEDVRLAIEAQVPSLTPTSQRDAEGNENAGQYFVRPNDLFLRASHNLLRSFFTNAVDVNLALTQAIVAVALCIDVRLDMWLSIDSADHGFDETAPKPPPSWNVHLDEDEKDAISSAHQATRRPVWSESKAPTFYKVLRELVADLAVVRAKVPNFNHLITGRKSMLEASNLTSHDLPNKATNPLQPSFLNAPNRSTKSHSRSSSANSLSQRRSAGANIGSQATKLTHGPSVSLADGSPSRPPANDDDTHIVADRAEITSGQEIFQPPPPEPPSTTDVLMQMISFPAVGGENGAAAETDTEAAHERKASLNHVLTNVVVLQEFVLELCAVMQVRAAVLGEREVRVC